MAVIPFMGMTCKDTIEISATYDEVIKPTYETIVATEATTVTPMVETTVAPTEIIVNSEETSHKTVEHKTNTATACEANENDYELDLLARVIYQEAGICGEYCQWLVGSAALNLADERGGLESVVFDYDTFNVAYVLYDDTPSDLSYYVANRLMSGDRDYAVKAFRTSYYHDFGTPYTNVDNVYFSSY